MQYPKSILALSFFVSFIVYLSWPFALGASLTEKLVSVSYFIALIYLAGYSVTLGFAFSKDFFELHLMRTGLGLAVLPLAFVLLDTAGIPLHWLVLLVLAVICPLKLASEGRVVLRSKQWLQSADWHTSIVVLSASVVFIVALVGSFSYPYLEDGDSWEHAVGVKYVSQKLTYAKPRGVYVSHYLPPYPPTYDTLLALVHQLNASLQWTMKSFNALMIGLTIIYAYYFIKEFTSDRDIALYAAIFLAAVPGFGSHTVWSHTLGMAVFFPAFYAVAKMKSNRMFTILSILLLASSMITQPLVSMVAGVFYILHAISRAIYGRKEIKTILTVGALALLVSMIYWAPSVIDYGIELTNVDRVGGEVLEMNFRLGLNAKEKPPDIKTVVLPLYHGDIYMQPGFGLFYCVLTVLGAAYAAQGAWKTRRFLSQKVWLLTALSWLGFTFIALESANLPISVYPARFWGMLPIGGSIVAAYGTAESVKKMRKHGVNPKTASIILVLLVLATSGYYKFQVQTGNAWPTDIKTHLDGQAQGYVNLTLLPPNTMVYPICLDDKFVIGMDKMSMPWDPDVVGFRHSILQKTSQELYSFLKTKGYKYAMVESYCIKRCVDEGHVAVNKSAQSQEEFNAVRDVCLKRFNTFLLNILRHPGFRREYDDKKTGLFRIE